MLSACLVLLAAASVLSESVRETETWTPLRSTRPAAAATPSRGRHEASGDSPNGSDFGFTDGEDAKNDYDAEDDEDEEEEDGDYYPDTLYDEEDEEEYDGFSGSGDGARASSPAVSSSSEPDVHDNNIPEAAPRPAAAEPDLQNHNEVLAPEEAAPAEEPSNVLMSHAGDDSVFNKTEVLAALVAGGAVGLTLAVLLVLLLVHRMKKKDEGSYELGRTPIYRKTAPTEIYA